MPAPEIRKGGLPVVFYDPSVRGGVCHFTYNLAESLAGLGCRVTVLTSRGNELAGLPRRFKLVEAFKPGWINSIPSRLRVPLKRLSRGRQPPATAERGSGSGVRPDVSPLQRFRDWLFLLRVVVRIFSARSRIVHIQWSVNRERDFRLIRLLNELGIRTVYTAHNLLPHRAEQPGDREAFTNLYQAVDRVVVFGEGSRRELIESFSLVANRVSVIPHGSDSFLFSNIAQESARAELGIGSERRVVLFFGHIKRYKGLEYLVQAFDGLRGRVDGALLLIAGKVEKGDPGDFERYSALLGTLQTRDDVVCASEYIPVSRVGLYFAAADVVALPYAETYHSGILMTAYAAGRPVVATNTGTLAEDVQEGHTGFVVPPKDAGALADRLVEILMSPDRGRSLGDAARRLSETRYSWSAVAERTLALYRELLKEGAEPQQEGRPDAAEPRDSDQARMPAVRGGRS